MIGLLAVSIVVGSLAACGDSESPASDGPVAGATDELVAAAKQEGTFNVYTSLNAGDMERLLDRFEEEYGIKGNFVRLDALADQTLEEAKSGLHKWDTILYSIEGDGTRLHDAGLLAPMTGIQNFDSWPERSRIADYSMIVGYNLYVFTWNTDKVKDADAPKTYADYLKPQFKGEFCAPNANVSPNYVWFYQVAEKAAGPDFLAQLKANGLRPIQGISDCAQSVAAGEASLGFGAQSVVSDLQKKGAPVGMYIQQQVTGPPRFAGLSANAKSPNAAKLFLNFIASIPGQVEMNGSLGLTAPIDGVEGATTLPSEYQSLDLDSAQSDKARVAGLLGF